MAKAAIILEKGSYSYNFGYGWAARVDVKIANAREAANLRKKSKGFNGYDWMVQSILEFGEILDSNQQVEKRAMR